MEISFASKRVLVTGAGQGIGRDLVKKLLACGAEVVAVSRTAKHLDSLSDEERGRPLRTICADLSDWEAAQAAARDAGPVDCLVNNAAVALLDPLLDVKPQDVDATFNCNVKSVIAVSQVVARGMIERKRGGSIVNVSSQASQAALADHTVYCASKGAVDMVSKVMALELGPHDIRVNAVNPTVVMTAMGRVGWSKPEKAEPMLAKIPLHRFAEVDEVVNAILFLLSDKASMISGVTLPVDGGFLAC
ncbi:L-xylulose reductase-like isoform X2 [Bacillus rossius redtenbacheri]|uniref:L-xylulose reductase-like isoform X2 n=1 Tax=Bacillus rossius redtenbacheri TaxID=93214 RepID=UPI002FDDB7B2